MEEFLDKLCYIAVNLHGRDLFYLCAKVTNVTDTHISFEDTTNNDSHCFRKTDIVEIKLSTRGEQR